MQDNQDNQKTIELWEGFTVVFDDKLFNDFDFVDDLSTAVRENNVHDTTMMYMALVGGEETYRNVREHIEEKYGYFDVNGLREIVEKIEAFFPKSGNRAQRRSWNITRS